MVVITYMLCYATSCSVSQQVTSSWYMVPLKKLPQTASSPVDRCNDHTGHTCDCHEVGFDPVWLLIVPRKPDKLLDDMWSRESGDGLIYGTVD